MGRSLSTIVFYGYVFTEEEAGLIDQAQSFTMVGEGNALEWRSFGSLDYEGCGMALMAADSVRQEYGATPISIGTAGIQPNRARILVQYLKSIEVTPPELASFPQWWAVSSYG